MRFAINEAIKYFGDKPVECAEIGSYIGDNAHNMLSSWKTISKLHLIDSFEICPDFRNIDEQAKNKDILLNRFKDNQRVNIIIEPSVEASKRFDKGSLDFVYIDANHSYEAVKQDIISWIPKVKSGGIISGHDYEYVDLATNERSVKKAVDEIFGKKNIKVGVFIKGIDIDKFIFIASFDWWFLI